MKNAIILLISLVSISLASCGQASLKYDFAKLKSQADVDSLLKIMMQENEDAKIDTVYRFNEVTVKGMHYNGVPVKSALITDHYTLLTTDTINFSGKKLLEALEAEKGLTKKEETYNDDIEFKWATETDDTEIKLKLVNGKHLATMGDKDYAELTIKYKPVYDVPLANIHKEIKTFDNQPIYEYQIRADQCIYDISINDVLILESSTSSSFNLNNFITGELSSLKIVVKPSSNNIDESSKGFNEGAYFSVHIVDKSTGKSIKKIDRTMLKGSNPIEFKLDFNSALPYYPKAWTDGADLRNDKNLKEKIIAFYDKLGKVILSKDEQTFNDMFYQKNFELQQLAYDTYYGTARNEWEGYLTIRNNSYKYTVAKDFDIEFNADGRLIYAYPKDKNEMLIFTGKGYDETLYYYLYQPKGSNELKIIR